MLAAEEIAAVASTKTISVTFVPKTADTSGTITADDGDGHSAATDIITVSPAEPAVSHIAIRDAAGGFGEQVITRTLTLSDTLVLYAAAYDADGNYLKDVPPKWASTGTLDAADATDAISITYLAATPAVSGTIVAGDADGRTAETDVIEVVGPMMASNVEAAALNGTWTSTLIGIVNLENADATVNMTLYNAQATPVATPANNVNVPACQGLMVTSGSLPATSGQWFCR